jgi:hypothetical protein
MRAYREQVGKSERPPKGGALSEWVAAHPAQWGIVSGVGAFFVAGVLDGLSLVALVLAPLFGLANWWIWRQGGPAHDWRASILERFPPRGR